MSYSAKTIKDVVGKISNNEVYLPAIQRRFVWTHEQIEKLFDSIMLGYPIGTFLFWNVKKINAKDYTFYKFIQEYHERDKYLNELAPKPEMKDLIIGVLDGQQRLSSMYLALQGSYAYKKPRARWDNNDAFPKRLFYINLLKNTCIDEETTTYEYKFLTPVEASSNDEYHYWFPVKDALMWNDANDWIAIANEKSLLSNKVVIDNLQLLWQRITQDKIINYFEVNAQELDSILDIFIRVNSGGTVLSKSDLLFSTIVANWEKGREEIEDLLKNINNKGDKFDFDNDFIMRACLVLTDCPVLFNVKNFKSENITKIKDNWHGIKEAIKRTVDLLAEYGFSRENLTSRNAVIPVSYYLFKGGRLNADDKNNIRKYLIASLLKLVYGSKGDQVLDTIRNALRKEFNGKYVLRKSEFSYDDLKKQKLPADKSLFLSQEDIDELFSIKKGPYTFMVLSLLYPQLKLSQVTFHQDHLHPSSSFVQVTLNRHNVPREKWPIFQERKDTLPNLQLLQGSENETKSKTPLQVWIENNIEDKAIYMTTNYIPNVDLSLGNFDEFYDMRKQLMISRFKSIMEID